MPLKTVWPSGLRRWLQAPVRKGVGSNPTAVTHALQSVLSGAESGGTVPLRSFDSTVKRCGGMPLALAVAGLLLATRLCDICALEHCLSLWHRPCRDPGSNRGPSDLRSDALPTELSRRPCNFTQCQILPGQPNPAGEFCRKAAPEETRSVDLEANSFFAPPSIANAPPSSECCREI